MAEAVVRVKNLSAVVTTHYCGFDSWAAILGKFEL